MDNFITDINKIYKTGFLEKYGGSLWLTIIFIVVMLLGMAYFHVLNNLQPIKKDWVNQRCNPSVMPFAGIINKPSNKTVFEFTSENFSGCIQTILGDMIGTVLLPFHYAANMLLSAIKVISDAVNEIRQLFNKMRSDLAKVNKEIMNKSLNILIPITHIVIKIKDLFGKSQGMITSVMYTFLGVYMTLRAMFDTILKSSIALLIMMVVSIIGYLAIPFVGLFAAIPAIVVFIMITIPLIMVIVISGNVLRMHAGSPPGLP
tara:strand:- start:9865 stop:10644 length:780 start_codon:yes stop_codon:yes gene_type:complete